MKSSLRCLSTWMLYTNFFLSILNGTGYTPSNWILSPEAEVTELITLSFFGLFPTGNTCINLAAVMQQMSAPVSYSALILCPLISTETQGFLDFFIQELSFWMVLFINPLYTMDMSLIEWQLVWGDPVGGAPGPQAKFKSIWSSWSLTDLTKPLRCLTSDGSISASCSSSTVANLLVDPGVALFLQVSLLVAVAALDSRLVSASFAFASFSFGASELTGLPGGLSSGFCSSGVGPLDREVVQVFNNCW